MKFFDVHRAKVMLLAAGLSGLSLIFCIVAVCALSTNNDTVKNTNWTYGVSDNSEYFVGLKEVVIKVDGFDEISSKWEDTSCPDSYCDDCKDACDSSITTAIMSLITCLPTLATDFQRSTVKGDLNCQKFMGIFTGVVGTITTLAALSSYADGCYRNLPNDDGSGNELTWYLGPGFTCLLLATFLKPVDVLIHLLTPVGKKEVPLNEK
eukprot:CAMPEP_0185024610 /NCGR_PEP_ID=MMETSP1103-20130426/7760_1 /TAXON_ID=36769 /ORGANISM="Paraphysomonas bandaiensis, Strain Caron Lab Isolate" /LENGTH=207 /DNA_ID=CAMNT_0027557627 /DNA_START=158 /DNA_END=781 /DNA_ORIENTATION=+